MNSALRAAGALFLIVGITAALLHFGSSRAAAADPSLAIDAGVEGNQAMSVGTIENCIAVKKNDVFQMDVVVQNISQLLAWQIYVGYDPAVVIVTAQEVKLFQQVNAGSSVIDLSDRVPDASGLYSLAAFDSSDPPTPDSGTGVLGRVTMTAVGSGDTTVSIAEKDIDGDAKIDKGPLLRDSDAKPINDPDGDTLFDGEKTDARVVVDGNCPPGSVIAPAPRGTASSSSPSPLIIVAGAAVAATVLLGAGVAVLLARRRAARRRSPAELANRDG